MNQDAVRYDPALLRVVRQQTHAGWLACRSALLTTNGNIPQAVALLQRQQAETLAQQTDAPVAACSAALQRASGLVERAVCYLAEMGAVPWPPHEPPIAPAQLRITAFLEGEAPAASLETTEEVYACAATYNWDDGVDGLVDLLDHPQCDWGTALLIYWRGAPEDLDRTGHFIARWPDEQAHHAMLLMIEQRVLAGAYPPFIAYDPTNDHGENLVLLHDGPPDQATVPMLLRQPAPGHLTPRMVVGHG